MGQYFMLRILFVLFLIVGVSRADLIVSTNEPVLEKATFNKDPGTSVEHENSSTTHETENNDLIIIITAQGPSVENSTNSTTAETSTVESISDVQPSFDFGGMFPVGSDFCTEKSQCANNSYALGCSCDSMCGVLNDCCANAENTTDYNMKTEQFSCQFKKGIGHIMLVSKCAADWTGNDTKSLCEGNVSKDDTLSRVLVSHKTINGMVYKNMHCALCNNVHEYEFWKVIFECAEKTDNKSDCELEFKAPDGHKFHRDCSLHSKNIVSQCPTDYNQTVTRQNCKEESTLLVYSEDGYKYKNEHCAVCNGYTGTLFCQVPLVTTSFGGKKVHVDRGYSYRMLVDFNTRQTFETKIDESGFSDTQRQFKECKDDEIYDPVADVCRHIICPDGTQPTAGKCVPIKIPPHLLSFEDRKNAIEQTEQCPFSKLNPQEFKYLNKTHQIVFRNVVYNETDYITNGSDIFLCINTTVNVLLGPSMKRTLQTSDEVERYMSFIGLIISIIALIITIIVYFTFTELLNIPGKTLVSLCFSLLMSQLLFLLSPLASDTNIPCVVVAVLMHYGFLSAFSWMNVIAFDLLMTFSNMTRAGNRGGKSSKQFYKYCFYCWGVPLVIVCFALVLEFVNLGDDVDTFRPRYSENVCWISSRNALLLFFVGPMALFKIFDVVAFLLIVYFITQATKQGSMATNKKQSRNFFIHLKLSLVMGLTWIFAFIANFTGSTIMWYFFIICNTLQGLLIAISFICTRKVLKLVKSRYYKGKSKTITSTFSTRATSVS